MKSYLITPSLLQSFQYFIDYDEDEACAKYSQGDTIAKVKTNAQIRTEFLQTLSREKFSPNEAMQAGIEFEDRIKALCDGAINSSIGWKYDDAAKEIAGTVWNGAWQEKCSREIELNNENYLLYGKMDVVKRDWIYDIKFVTKTSNYEVGKFLNSVQHRIYLFCTGFSKFAYLVSDGKQVWREEYRANSDDESFIKNKISEFRNYLKNDSEMELMFLTKWESK